jgi:homoserine dehydrogenase
MPVPRTVRLGLLGFGSVGRAFAALVAEEGGRLARERGVRLVVTGVSTRRFGSRTDDRGLDLRALAAAAGAGAVHGPAASPERFAATCPADVIVETMPLEPFTGRTAIAATRAALIGGRSVVSANKGPVAHALRELAALSAGHGVAYRYESAVADGLPVFNLITCCLPGADVIGFTGLVSSTANVVLHEMSEGRSIAAAVARAQELGITEADPAYDLDGWDAAVKLAALSAAVWGQPLKLDGIERQVVEAGSAARAADARGRGRRLVSLAELTRGDAGGLPVARVRLVELGPEDALFALTGTSLGLQITSRLLCPVTVSSLRPAQRDTAYGLLADVLSLPAVTPPDSREDRPLP